MKFLALLFLAIGGSLIAVGVLGTYGSVGTKLAALASMPQAVAHASEAANATPADTAGGGASHSTFH